MTLRVALVGCGKIADGHVEEIAKLPNARVVAVCDRELLMAEQLATRYGIAAYHDDMARMLAEARPDVVHITTPPASHLALARAAIDAGAHVYVEKPLTPSYADTRALVEHAARAGRKLTVGYTYHFDPPAVALRRLLAEGVIGDVVHVESYFGYSLAGSFGAAIAGDAGHWVHGLPGKLFHNNIDHLLDKLAEHITDEEPRLQAMSARRRAPVGDVRDQMHDELRIVIVGREVSGYGTFTSHVQPAAHFLRIYGSKCIAHADFVARTVTLDGGATVPSAIGRLLPAFQQAGQLLFEGGRNVLRFANSDFHFFCGLQRLIAGFYAAILDGAPLPISTDHMLRVALLQEHIYAQIDQRRTRV